MNTKNTCIQEPNDSNEIPREINLLADSIASLENIIKCLEKRLNPIIPQVDSSEPEPPPVDPMCLTPLGTYIQNLRYQTNHLYKKINGLTNTIQL